MFKTLLGCSLLLFTFAGCDAQQKNAPAKSVASSAADASSEAVETVSSASLSETVSTKLIERNRHAPGVLFQKCAACHGSHAEKSALNQSAVIAEWDAARIASAIKGYQKGTYGGAMKTLMQNQVKDLSADDIEALAHYIANLHVKTH